MIRMTTPPRAATRKHRPALLAMATLLALASCETTPWIEISASSGSPPAREASITNRDGEHRIVLSVGVALMFDCYSGCHWPCEDPQFVVANPSVLDVLPVEEHYYSDRFVLVGRSVGHTTLTVSSECADQLYDVEVISAPAAN